MKKSIAGVMVLSIFILLTGVSQAYQVAPDDDRNAPLPPTQDTIRDFAKAKTVAAAQVNSDSTLALAWRVDYVNWDSTWSRWQIKFKGPAKNYYYSKFIALITPIYSATGCTVETGSISGMLNIYMYDLKTGNRIKENFSVVIFKTK